MDFIVNMEQKTCRIIHNEYDLGIVFRDFTDIIVPAVSNNINGEHGDFEFV